MYWKVVEGYAVLEEDGGACVDTFGENYYDEALYIAHIECDEPAYVKEVFLLVRGKEHGEWFNDEDEALDEAKRLNHEIALAQKEEHDEWNYRERQWEENQ